MLYAFIAGFGLLFAVVMMVNWFNTAAPKDIMRGLKWLALGVLVVAFVLLLVTGRLGWALAALAAIVPLGARLLRLLVLGQIARGAFSGLGGNPFGGLGGSRTGQGPGASTVSSRYLEMTLDHVTGRMDGRVLEGPLTGRILADLSEAEAVGLWHTVGNDPDSRRLLETWMERAYPDWRDAAADQRDTAQDQGRKASSSGTMTRQEALDVLGLPEDADDDQVRAAYRRLMARAHPDQGGSTWMAAKLNEARAVLLGNDK